MLKRAVSLSPGGVNITGQLYLPGNGAQYPAVCICHGIPSGEPPDPGDGGYPRLAEIVCQHGFAVLIFNFRGCGSSGGNLDMTGWATDLAAAVDYLWGLGEVDNAHLVLLGFSGGAAVSVYVASQDKRVSGVAACACPADFGAFISGGAQPLLKRFRSIGAIRDAAFPPAAGEWLDGFRRISPIEYVAGIAPRQLLLVHGSQDETVPVSHAHRLYARAGQPKQLVIIDGAGHRLRQEERAVSTVIRWLKAC